MIGLDLSIINKYSFWECINCFMKNLFSIINPSGLEQIHTFVVISMSCTHTICCLLSCVNAERGVINYSTMRSYREIHKKRAETQSVIVPYLRKSKALISARTNAIWLSCQTQYANCHSQDAWRTAAFHQLMLLLNIDLLIHGLVSWTSRIGVKGE